MNTCASPVVEQVGNEWTILVPASILDKRLMKELDAGRKIGIAIDRQRRIVFVQAGADVPTTDDWDTFLICTKGDDAPSDKAALDIADVIYHVSHFTPDED